MGELPENAGAAGGAAGQQQLPPLSQLLDGLTPALRFNLDGAVRAVFSSGSCSGVTCLHQLHRVA